MISDGATVAVNSSSGLCCPDLVLEALGQRFRDEGHPRALKMIHPIAAGDMFGTKGVDHLAQEGMIDTIIGGSYPSGPSSAEPPLIWQMVGAEQVAAYNIPSCIIFDILREAAGLRPGVITKVVLDTFARVAADGLAPAELEKARNRLETRFYRQLQTVQQRAAGLGYWAITADDCYELFVAADRLRAVTADDVVEVAREVLRPDNRTVVIGRPAD